MDTFSYISINDSLAIDEFIKRVKNDFPLLSLLKNNNYLVFSLKNKDFFIFYKIDSKYLIKMKSELDSPKYDLTYDFIMDIESFFIRASLIYDKETNQVRINTTINNNVKRTLNS